MLAGSDPGHVVSSSAPAASVSASQAGSYSSISASTSFGSASVNATGIRVANGSKRGYTACTAKWSDTFTIQPGNPALLGTPGTALLTFHVTGDVSTTLLGQSGIADFTIVWDNTTQYRGYFQNNDGFAGSTIASISTFTRAIPFTFGTPTPYDMSLSGAAQIGSANVDGSGSVHVALTQGTLTVLDNVANPTAYFSTSGMGASRSRAFTNGESYAGFTLTNSIGSSPTTLSLLGGTANSNGMVTATFIANTDTNHIVSDVVDLEGVGTNMFVIQADFNIVAAFSHFGDSLSGIMMSFNESIGRWLAANKGNSDGGAAGQTFNGPFNPATQFQLGNSGTDTNNHVAWAVVDHNSRFAVGQPFTPAATRWTAITAQTNRVILALQGPALGQYIVETNTSVATTNWRTLGLTTLDSSGSNTITDSNSLPAAPQKFYRARQ